MDSFVKRIPAKGSDQKPAEGEQAAKAGQFMTLEQFKDELGTWKSLLAKYLASGKFLALHGKVSEVYNDNKKICYPPQNQIFNCFKRTTLQNIKVVIVGQDPYHQPGQAMGLCFSVNKGIKVPPSLVNIYKEMAQDKAMVPPFKVPSHGDLSSWADQGVLLLNTVLTVEESKPNIHQKFGWLDFTNEVIKIIANDLENIIFILWGAPAHKKEDIIKGSGKTHHVLKSAHPSPLSAHNGFFGCGHFSQVNVILEKLGKTKIDWSLPA